MFHFIINDGFSQIILAWKKNKIEKQYSYIWNGSNNQELKNEIISDN